MLTRYEIARLAAAPAFPAFDARVRRELRRLARTSSRRPARVLDVGARTSPYTAGVPVRVTVLDVPRQTDGQRDLELGMTDAILEQLRARRSNIERVLLEDMTECSEPSGSYDGVLAVEVIEHIAQDERFVAQMARVLRPGGWALVTTPNGDYVGAPADNPDHLRHYGREELRDVLGRHFPEVHVEYAIRTGPHRWRGQMLGGRGPLGLVRAGWSNLVNRWQSRDVADQPRRTANLLAVCRVDPGTPTQGRR